jgi:hypothetical protein
VIKFGSTGDGMLPVSYKEHATPVPYLLGMDSLIKNKIKNKHKKKGVVFKMVGCRSRPKQKLS